jgi:hypothetical protein
MLRKFGCVLAAVTMSYGAALADADSDAAKKLGLYGAWSLFDCAKLEVAPIWVFAETSTGTLETYSQLPTTTGKIFGRGTVRNVRSIAPNRVSYEVTNAKGTISFFTVALIGKTLQVMESRNSLGEVLITGGRVASAARPEVQKYTKCT